MLDVVTQWFSDAQANIVWDALIVAAIFAGSQLFAFTLGRNSIMVSFVAVVFAGLIVTLLPDLGGIEYLAKIPEFQINIGIFVIATLLFGIIFRRNRFFEPYIVPTGLERVLFATALAGLIVVMLGTFLSTDVSTSTYVSQIFLHPVMRVAWLLAPVVMMAVFRGENA